MVTTNSCGSANEWNCERQNVFNKFGYMMVAAIILASRYHYFCSQNSSRPVSLWYSP